MRSRALVAVATSCHFALVGSLVWALVGCSAGDGRPPAEASESGRMWAPDVGSTSNDDDEANLCTPRTRRECSQMFRDGEGRILYCRPSFEFCKADGSGWHTCGKYSVGPKGELIAPD